MEKLRSFFSNNAIEIEKDRMLQVYGALLSSVHVLTWVFWNLFGKSILTVFSDKLKYPVCWGFLENCAQIRPLNESVLQFLNYGYLVAGLVGVMIFLIPGRTKLAYYFFLFLNLFKMSLYLQDYRLMGNYHYMPFIVSFVFLFVPNKRQCIQVIVIAFYFGAGLLKMNYEWISGSAMVHAPIIQGKLLEAACAYVVLLELVFVWLLLFRKKKFFYFAAIQVFCFHAFSWTIVGFFYPLTMGVLLSIFFMDRYFEHYPDRLRKRENLIENEEAIYSKLLRGKLAKPTYGCLTIFALMQLAPWLFGAHSSITSEGRIYSLNMFDAQTQCDTMMIARYKDYSAEAWERHDRMGYGVRIWCDPLVHYSKAKWICEQNRIFSDFKDMDIYMNSRRRSDSEYVRVYAVQNICSEDPGYNVFIPNSWIEEDKL